MRLAFRVLILSIAISHSATVAIRSQTRDLDPIPSAGEISGRVNSASGELPNNTTVYVSLLGAALPPRSALIKSDGTFKVDGLENGVYRVWAGAPGFVSDVSPAESRNVYHLGDSAYIYLRKGAVITGTVRNSNNTPMVAVNVRAFRVRDENGKPLNTTNAFNERLTDDRGVYRIYGLIPGTYIVSAGGSSRMYGGFGSMGYEQEAPTYAPSATRDTATELTIRSGEEVTADIQYRGEPGHAISGTVTGTAQTPGQYPSSASVTIIDVKNRTVLFSAFSSAINDYTFAVLGLPDGEYELVAQQTTLTRESRGSAPKRIKLQGADVPGVNLTLAALPAISGRVVLDRSFSAECVKRRDTIFQTTMIVAQRDKQPRQPTDGNNGNTTEPVPLLFTEQSVEALPDAKGDFVLRNLRAGTFRVNVTLPSTAWYLRSVTIATNPRSNDFKVISEGVTLNAQSVSGITITISEGAARIRGKVTTGGGQVRPDRVIVYLMPAEKDAANNLLRYFETRPELDGGFDVRNVPPGDYSIVSIRADSDPAPGVLIRQDSALRASAIREAEKLKQTVTLRPCERVDSFDVPFSPTNRP